ncbi:metallophosphoesterase [Pseudomonas sp. RIT-PI-S]|uniref:metallophosphoesterase n=1 Tax=Pseudomonas sp. RIT-PI-S TaxID=3035295 RepID=UPI0021D9D990|nr:metallophosphoesterase [Pseudomonas sp. RIT-PI-S]
MARFEHFGPNPDGRDYAVGDIHGHFTRLEATLDRARFDPARDRLFSVGDLVDRGPESPRALEWLEQPWFHAVQGNHEVLTRQYVDGDPQLDPHDYRSSGGTWFMESSPAEQMLYADRFSQLPIALEIETAQGLVGLVHAHCPFSSWTTLREYLTGALPYAIELEEAFQWSRARLKQRDESEVRDVRAVVVGHTPLRRPRRLGNVWHIDTAGWSEGYFSLLELGQLKVVPA